MIRAEPAPLRRPAAAGGTFSLPPEATAVTDPGAPVPAAKPGQPGQAGGTEPASATVFAGAAQPSESTAPEGAADETGERETEQAGAAQPAGLSGPTVWPLVLSPVAAVAPAPIPGGAEQDASAPGPGAAVPGVQAGLLPKAAAETARLPAEAEASGAAADSEGQAEPKAAASPGGNAPAAMRLHEAIEVHAPALATSAPDILAAPALPAAQPSTAAVTDAVAAAARQPAEAGAATPTHKVPIEIGLRALAGARQFEIRLDPDELGRVDVRLEISESGEVKARLTVERVETLHLLQRDARTLERAFEQAGLKPSDGGVDFALRDHGGQQSFREQPRPHAETPSPFARQVEAEDAPAAAPAPPWRTVRLGGVDLSI